MKIHEGMKVRDGDHRRLGHVVAVEAEGFLIERGIFFHDTAFAHWDDVISIDQDTIVVAVHRPSLQELAEKSSDF